MRSSHVPRPSLRSRIIRGRYQGHPLEYIQPYPELTKLTQSTENLQYEFQSTYLETARQHSNLNNDIAVIKNTLKIPSLATPHEVYLSSDFFKERVNAVNSRMRDHGGRGGRRQRTNLGNNGGTEKMALGTGSRVSVLQ